MIARLRTALVLACALALPGGARAASAPAIEAENGMVVSSQALASRVGADILAAGGAMPSMRRWRSPSPRRW